MGEPAEIITALRAPSWQQDSHWHDPKGSYATKPKPLLDEAADLIQSLQAEVERLTEAAAMENLDATQQRHLVESLQAEITGLREALRPFAEAARKYETDCFWASREASVAVPDDFPVLLPGYDAEDEAARVTIGDFRQALSSVSTGER